LLSKFIFYMQIVKQQLINKYRKEGLIKFLVPINICSFAFSPYKNKSHFLVLTKFSVIAFSLCC